MYHFYQPTNIVAQNAAMYDLLANYYKYLDPQRHIYYYQLHFMCMQQLCQLQAQQQLYRHFEENRNYYRATAKVRVLHASPDAPAVDVYVNGEKTFDNMTYYQISPYLEIPAGSYEVEIYPAGQTTNPVLSQTIEVGADQNYTVAASDRLNNIQLVPVVDTTDIPRNKSKVRFLHISPNTPAVDIAVQDGDILFENISFGNASDYIEVDPGRVTLEVRKAGTNEVILTLRNTNLRANEAYTITAIGIYEGRPRLEALILEP
ncbi:hypothetical protein BKP37_01940 [Anaerobacillus alkalilacustris]|uniref:DUF4397 domain-containing protein n=1 Tax=Anaerobacillus alkalilacustris TaxID=393763 RepID=A0A1S2LXQ5_9BACI|nr:DUF4397 domain-containing protein [Anaerobacillus alkalilacustris]OIJ17289.1 hypothetical protein BKP37_01940 [Anaerobacillus alkalilacustris]